MQCTESSCQGGLDCCVETSIYPGFYCKVVSQCFEQPLWQVIVIPCLLAVLAISMALMVFLKLRKYQKKKRDITTFAYEEIRVKPRKRNPTGPNYLSMGQTVSYKYKNTEAATPQQNRNPFPSMSGDPETTTHF